MKLEYHILWFEDSKDYIDSFIPLINNYLDEEGFNVRFTTQEDDNDLPNIMEEWDVDLILVDYNLKGIQKGDKLLEKIRNNELYTEAIFYSKQIDYKKSMPAWLEGIYFANRDRLEEKTKKIIDLTIMKSQDFYNVRGLFIAETIDMTKKIEEILSNILNIKDKEYTFFMNEIMQLPGITDQSKLTILNRFFKSKIAELHTHFESISSGEERDKLDKLIKEMQSIKNMLSKYFDEILETRNSLAHGKPVPNKKNSLIWKKKEIIYDKDKCREIRKSFLKHNQNLDDIIKLLDHGS